MNTIAFQPEYNAIVKHYGVRTAERSGVPLINHIHEGVAILAAREASMDAMRAFCLHPLIQDDLPLWQMSENDILYSFSPRVVLLSMEYRQRANAWLSDKVWKSFQEDYFHTDGLPYSGYLPEVKEMLVADKVQNYKDFVKHHLGKHERSAELDYYFKRWFDHLGIDYSATGSGPSSYYWLVNQLEE